MGLLNAIHIDHSLTHFESDSFLLINMSKVLKSVIAYFEDNLSIDDGRISKTLYRPADGGKVSVWTITIELSGDRLILPEHISGTLLPGETIVRTSAGFKDGKIREYKPQVISAGKQGTNIVTQAIKTARKKIIDKIEKGYSAEGEARNDGDLFATNRWRIAPPAFFEIDDHWDKVTYPCYVQPKKDGNRLLVVNHPTEGVKAFTRRRKDYKGNQPVLMDELAQLLKDYPGIYLDGELRGDTGSFQTNSGLARRQGDDAIPLFYYVFDVFSPEHPNETFAERLARRDVIFLQGLGRLSLVKPIETFEVKSYEELEAFKNAFVKDASNDGAIVRLSDGNYKYSLTAEKRVHNILKWKDAYDAEWIVVGFTSGTGEHQDAIVWQCAVDKNVKVVPGGALPSAQFGISYAAGRYSIEERQNIYHHLIRDPKYFPNNFLGQQLTIQYQSLTDDGIPYRGGALRFRDDDVQELVDLIAH